MLADVYADSLAFVQYHKFDEHSTPWGDARWTFYQGEYTPLTVFDGTDSVVGAVDDIYQQYFIYRANHFLPLQIVPTDVTIELSAEYLGGQTFSISALVGIEAGGTGKTMRVYMVQVLDHWPATPAYHRNGFRQAAETTDIALTPGGSQLVVNDFTFDAESWADHENIKIVVWAQAVLEDAPGEVYQAATRSWPLISGPDDADGDGVVDLLDNCSQRYNPDQDDGDGDNIGDDCDDCAGLFNPDQTDTDEDSIGDACDNCPILHHLSQEDSDSDGVGDACDFCPEVGAPGGVDSSGRSLGTIDLDCDLDLDDFALFTACFNGPESADPPLSCTPEYYARADVDDDNDVDMDDYVTFSALNYTGPLVGPSLYIGAESCGAVDCHPVRHTEWSETTHATAFDTLIESDDGDNPLCFPCHAVAYGQPSGFVDLDTTPQLAGVQCETCHGPGSSHAADPPNVMIGVNMDADLCGLCHQSCHGMCGDDHHPHHEQWSTSKHAGALWTAMNAPDFEASCLECHSAEYRLAPEGEEPDPFEVSLSVECVVCHDPHGSPNFAQLRLPHRYLCADCHTMQSAGPGELPHSPQAEMLHGFGGFNLDGTPLRVPATVHWWGITEECAACHVHSEPYGGPNQPANSGHTFEANMRACLPCHAEKTAEGLMSYATEAIGYRLGLIAPFFDPEDPLYLDPTTLPPEELNRYLMAKFDYDFVLKDESYGVHSTYLTCALLNEVESFFGLPIAFCPDW